MIINDLREYYADQRRLRFYRRLRRIGLRLTLFSMLIWFACMLTLCNACSVPESPEMGAEDGVQDESYADLVRDARAAWDQQPRTAERVKDCVAKFERAFKLRVDDYEALWQSARALVWLADWRKGLEPDAERGRWVDTGRMHVDQALRQRPDGLEALYYRAILYGFTADINNLQGPDAVSKMEADLKRQIELKSTFMHAGAHRVYGSLLYQAPGPPTSVGSLRNSRKQLEAALAMAPDWPENHLEMATLEVELGKSRSDKALIESAKSRLDKHLLAQGLVAPADHQFEFAQWQRKAKQLLHEANELLTKLE